MHSPCSLYPALTQMRSLETDGSGSRAPGDGLWLLWMVVLLILGNAFCHVQGVLPHPPQNVTLTSENFFILLTWQPSLDFTGNNTQYEVEIRTVYSNNSGLPEWTKVTSCQKNKTRRAQRCDLPLSSSSAFYQARVRAHEGARPSAWAYSNLLQPNKDTIIGPLGLFLAATDDNLTAVISLPPTPWADDNSSESFQYLRSLKYQVTLIEEGVELRQTELLFKEGISTINYTYSNLKHGTHYCVKAKATYQPTKESVQCMRMPGRPAGDKGILFIMVSVIVTGLILLSVMAGAFFKHHIQWNSLETTLPKSLTFLYPEPGGQPAFSPVLHLEEEHIAPAEVLPSETSTAFQLIPRSFNAQGWNTYCARVFYARSWSSDFLSSGELEYPMGENYRASPELTESSTQSSPSSARLLPHDTRASCIFQHWECQTDNKNRPVGSSLSLGPDIPFSSVKLQTMEDILYGPGTYFVRTDSGAPPGTPPAQQTSESEEHHGPYGFPKGSDFQDGSSLELRDMKTMTFSDYEPHQPILFCE